MKIKIHPFVSALAVTFLIPGCTGIPGESPENMQEGMERQDKMLDRYQNKQKTRSETADRRYDQWWNKAMGRPAGPSEWQQTY